MDRFKYRVFDKETGKYYKTRISKGSGCMVYQHPASSHYAWVQIGTMFAELERDEKTYALTKLEPDFIIEQCTGLKDKNGNLIYEGDILEVKWNNDDYPRYYEVNFEEGAFGIEPLECNDWLDSEYLSNISQETLIIGNIHETPELLEE